MAPGLREHETLECRGGTRTSYWAATFGGRASVGLPDQSPRPGARL